MRGAVSRFQAKPERAFLTLAVAALFVLWMPATAIGADDVAGPAIVQPEYCFGAEFSGTPFGVDLLDEYPEALVGDGDDGWFLIGTGGAGYPDLHVGHAFAGGIQFPGTAVDYPGTAIGTFAGTYTEMWINTNGNVTFDGGHAEFTPIMAWPGYPVIAPWFADWDFRGTSAGTYDGGIYYCEEEMVGTDPGRIIITWEGGYYDHTVSANGTSWNTVQLIFTQDPTCGGTAPFYEKAGVNMEIRYVELEWSVGELDCTNSCGGANGGNCPDPFTPPWDAGACGECYPAVAGWDVGDGVYAMRLPESGFPDVLDLHYYNLSGYSPGQEAGVFSWDVVPTCGDGPEGIGRCEQCDDGNSSNRDSCLNVCTWATCGDGYVFNVGDIKTPELCDGVNLQGASNSCLGYMAPVNGIDGAMVSDFAYLDTAIATGAYDAGWLRCPEYCGRIPTMAGEERAVVGPSFAEEILPGPRWYDDMHCFWACYEDVDDDTYTGTGEYYSYYYPVDGTQYYYQPTCTGSLEYWDEGDCNDDPTDGCALYVPEMVGTRFEEICDDLDCDNDCDCMADDFDLDDFPFVGTSEEYTDADYWYYLDFDMDFCGTTSEEWYWFCDASEAPEGYSDNDLDLDDNEEVPTGCCGNAVEDGGEDCDDGDTDNTDACLNTCENAFCGDGFIFVGEPIGTGAEACDDDDTDGGDGCSATCAEEPGWDCTGSPSVCTTTCGDGIVAGNEFCDDGDTTAADGCSATCTEEVGWDCTGSPSVCTEICGDGLIVGAEECDDDGTDADDGCSATCEIEDGYTCTGTPSVCVTTCGDGIVAGDEECDDDGTDAGDGCNGTCVEEAGWDCTGDPSVCTEVCGDGLIVGTEECDDENTANGDGCSSMCEIEDRDDDGVTDPDDNCPDVANPDQENHYGTDAGDACEDTDDDGLLDFEEDEDLDGILDGNETDPTRADTDNDGLPDALELEGQNPTNPRSPDTDGDGLCDGPATNNTQCVGAEDANANGRVDTGETNPNVADTDGGGVGDGLEVSRGTDPLFAQDDTVEVQGGSIFGCSTTNGQAGGPISLLILGGLAMGLVLKRRNR